MQICIPVTEDRGLQSPLSEHFGSAPFFMLIILDTGSRRIVSNRDSRHEHGTCQPLASLAQENVDVVVSGGIGRGALSKLQAANIRVLFSGRLTVEDTLSDFKSGLLKEVELESACPGHLGAGQDSRSCNHHRPV